MDNKTKLFDPQAEITALKQQVELLKTRVGHLENASRPYGPFNSPWSPYQSPPFVPPINPYWLEKDNTGQIPNFPWNITCNTGDTNGNS